MKPSFSDINEKLFSTHEISSIGTVGTMTLLHGKVAKLLNFIGRALAYTQTRAYGCFLLTFGISGLMLNLGEVYFSSQTDMSISTLIICAALILISVPFLFFERPMCIAMQDFPLTDKLFFEFLSIKRMRRNVTHSGIHPLAATVLGLLAAALGFLFSMESVILALIMFTVANIAFATPEFSMLLSILFLPYIMFFEPTGIIAAAISFVTFISFVVKVLVGKRVFHFNFGDVAFLLMMFSVFLFGIISDSGARELLIILSALLGYFPISNLIVNRRLAGCAEKAVIISPIPMSLIAIVEFIVKREKGIDALFDSSASLAAFLLVSSTFTLVYAAEKARDVEKFFCFAVCILELSVIGMLMRPEPIIAILIALVSYPILSSRKIPVDALALLIILPHAVFFLPSGVLDSVSGFFDLSIPFSENAAVIKVMLREFFADPFVGSGIGNAPVDNTLLGIGLSLGLFTVLFFVILVLLRLRHISYFRLYMRNSALGITGKMTELSMIVLFAYGAFYNFFLDYTVLSLFVSLFGMSAAALRTARKEYDDRMGYYGDSNSSESSALDVGVNRYN